MNPYPILQVEDEETDIFMLKTAFQRAGITNPVRVVTDGQMALDYLSGTGPFADRQQHPLPCLVLLDLKLPKLSGFEFLARIAQQPHLKKLVVIVFTSSADPADIDRAYELGASSYIPKPPDLAEATQFAQHLKGWWLTYNCFARIDDATQPTTSTAQVQSAPPR
jgi:CheY-like chemotaxis protein